MFEKALQVEDFKFWRVFLRASHQGRLGIRDEKPLEARDTLAASCSRSHTEFRLSCHNEVRRRPCLRLFGAFRFEPGKQELKKRISKSRPERASRHARYKYVPAKSRHLAGQSCISHRSVSSLKSATLPAQSGLHRQADCLIVFRSAVVVAEHLFRHVCVMVEWLNADVGSIQAALQQTPEILNSIRVDVRPNVGFGVVDDFMDVLSGQEPICGVLNRCESANLLPGSQSR